jgi:site-specific DNA recombinase
MKQYFGYTRVSTAKQGEQGVSLQEQQGAIVRYGQKNALEIAGWFEERETAAKRGRPVFNQMMRLLSKGKASGVIIHKIDRSARNLKDWADLGELIDRGVEVHFANEGLDLHSRGGRLSADIQAVVAADFIRNLREETRKGFYGRLKQGLYPMPAPLGYLDMGTGVPKTPDPAKAPMVRKAFELYGTGRFSLVTLVAEMFGLGLRNRNGGRVNTASMSIILNNPFYIGLIRVKKTDETFSGGHEPIIPKALFDRVQLILQGKQHPKVQKFDFLFRRLLACKQCGYNLVGEKQKGHVYYRCHSCRGVSVREETVEECALQSLNPIQFNQKEINLLEARVGHLRTRWGNDHAGQIKNLELHLSQLHDRLWRLTDAFLDSSIDKQTFETRKTQLLFETKDLEAAIAHSKENSRSVPDRLEEFLELAKSAYVQYKLGLVEEKRDLLRIVTSNRWVEHKAPVFTLSEPFREVAIRYQNSNGLPRRDIGRTLDALVDQLWKWFEEHPLWRATPAPIGITSPAMPPSRQPPRLL